MIALIAAILRSFASDRVAAALTLAAPVAFFTLFALFYRHLESTEGFKLEIAVVDQAGNDDSRRVVEAMTGMGLDHLRVTEVAGVDSVAANALATVRILEGFSRGNPRVAVRTQAPLPGASDAAVQVVQASVLRAFSDGVTAVHLEREAQQGMLLRGSAAGIALIFVMFSAASIAARGLGDDAAGLQERLRSLGISSATTALARIAAMTVIAWVQVALTLAWAAVAFGVVPRSPAALAVSACLGAAACTAFVALVATLAGNRTRFAAIAPVVILVVSALSGSMIPRVLLPDAVAGAGSWAFPAWGIDACSAAIEGHWDVARIGALAAFVAVCALGAIVLRRGAAR